jgi:hypothetical protein
MSVDPNQSLPPQPPFPGWQRRRLSRATQGWLIGLIAAAGFLIVVAALIVANALSGGVASRDKSSGGDHAASMARFSASACQRAIIAWFKENLDDPDFEIVKWHEPVPWGSVFRRWGESALTRWFEIRFRPPDSSEQAELEDWRKRLAAATEEVERSGTVLCFVKYRARNRSGVSQLCADVFVVQASGATLADHRTINAYRGHYCPDAQDAAFLPRGIPNDNTDLHWDLRVSQTPLPPLEVLRRYDSLRMERAFPARE